MSGLISSGEFPIPNCGASFRSATIFNGTLHVLGGSGGGITDTAFALQSLADGAGGINVETVRNPKNWPTTQVSSTGVNSIAATSTPDALFVFSTQPHGGLLGPPPSVHARKYSVNDSNSAGWSDDMLVDVGRPFSGISATAFGSQFILVAYILNGDPRNPDTGIYLNLFDTSYPRANWGPQAQSRLQPHQFSYYSLTAGQLEDKLTFQNIGNTVSIEWFSTVGTAPDGKTGAQQYFLAVSFVPQGASDPKASQVSLITFVPLNLWTDGTRMSIQLAPPPTIECFYRENGSGGNLPDPAKLGSIETCLMRDPAGRLKSYMVPQGPPFEAFSRFFPTTAPPTAATLQGRVDPVIGFEFRDNSVLPVGAFYTLPAEPTKLGIRVNGNVVQATQYPVVEFVFAGGNTVCQVNNYGSIQVLEKTVNPKTASTQIVYVVSGIIDGPIPLPVQNFKETAVAKDWGMLTYGTENTTIEEREVSNSWSVGFESSGKTTKGIGPAWKVSLEGGMGQVTGSSQGKTYSYATQQGAAYDLPQGENPGSLTSFGTLQTVSAAMLISAFRFVDAAGTLVSDALSADPGSAPKMAATLTSFTDPSMASYTPFAVTPGDLMSYTPTAWNARMKSLGYAGDNYYGDVICANAYPFQSRAQPYIPFTWAEGSDTDNGFTQFSETFTENSWSFDLSAYVGISGGGGFELFGMGDELEAEFLVGATYHHESTSTENKESQWGIEVESGWGPPVLKLDPNQKTDSVRRYEFRLFFLPVPKAPSTLAANYWTQELIANLKNDPDTSSDMIDPASCCWKICYVVTMIENSDHSKNYRYQNDLDRPSVYS